MKLIKRLFSWVFGKQLHGGDCFPRGTFHQLRNLSSCNAGNEGGSVGIVTEERRQMERFFQPLREYAEGA